LIYNKYREAAAVTQFFIVFLAFVVSPPWADRHCFLFQLKGKGSALSRGKSGMISILIDDLYFYPDTSDFISLNIVLDAFALPVKTNILCEESLRYYLKESAFNLFFVFTFIKMR
jgi:hypothetical protein